MMRRNRKNNWRILGLFLFVNLSVLAQDSLFTFDAFMQRVKEHHPVVYRGALVASNGDVEVMGAKGGFDPEIGGDIKQKYFDDKKYYSHINGYLKVPTWFGLSFETGYDQSEGVFLNPEDRLPQAGLLYAGASLELGSGLLIDQRRATLKQARLYQKATKMEQRVMLNQLLDDAAAAYWKWVLSYQRFNLFRDAVEVSKNRVDAVEEYVKFGDRPQIDYTEATMQYQNRLIQFQEAENEWKNSSAALEVYLWDQATIPLELNNAIPQDFELESNKRLIPLLPKDSLLVDHPFIVLNDLELQKLRIDLRLKKEYVKPKLTLKYRALNEPISNDLLGQYSIANYSWGATVRYPILTRKERADAKLSAIKLESQQYKNQETLAKLRYQYAVAQNTIDMFREQLTVMESSVTASQLMLDGEKNLFDNGESSLFMINARELKLLDAETKLLKIQSERERSFYYLKYGVLMEELP